MVPVLVSAGGAKWPTYALLDTGASVSAVNEEIVSKINAPLRTVAVELGTFNNRTTSLWDVASFRVENLNENFSIDVNNALVGKMLSTEREQPPKIAELAQIEHLKDIPFNELEDPTVGLLLDAKFAHSFITGDVRKGGPDDLVGLKTSFGWSVIGKKMDNSVVNTDIDSLDANDLFWADAIRRLFRQEFISREGEKFPAEHVHFSINDDLSLKQMQESVTHNEETKHYAVGVPWRLGREETAEIFSKVNFMATAKDRQEKLKKRFLKNPELRAGSFAQMADTLAQGHVRILENLDAPAGAPVAYMPNLVVTHPGRPGKYRLCQDAKARTGKHSVNKYILNGPDLMTKLVMVLFRFRRGRIAITADIREFFYQIKLDPMDSPAFRFFWWASESMEETVVMEACVHLFGIAASPAIAAFVLRLHAERIRSRYPDDVYWVLMFCLYVDDVLTSVDDIETARKLKKNLKDALAEAGMDLRKFKSNFAELNDEVPLPVSPQVPSNVRRDVGAEQNANGNVETNLCTPIGESPGPMRCSDASLPTEPTARMEKDDDVDTGEEMEDIIAGEEIDPNELVAHLGNEFELEIMKDFLNEVPDKVLGVGYSYETDELAVRVGEKHLRVVNTKEEVLSFIMSLYDPCGFLGPHTLRGRQFFQLINEEDISWKDTVPDHILIPFTKWKESTIHLKKIKIPRWTNPLGLVDYASDLIIFCDSSAKGYGFCAYVKRYSRTGGGESSVSFLFSKCHVVPLNMTRRPTENAISHGDSIPRLELMAAKLAAQWRDTIVRESGETFDNIYMFSDSLTVLGWLDNWVKRFKTFENFRIRAIQGLSRRGEWGHCPSKDNPSDDCSKGIDADNSKRWSFFHNGPSWLLSPPSEWPPKRPESANKISADIGAIDAKIVECYENNEVTAAELLVVGATAAEMEVEVEYHSHAPWPLKVSEKEELWSRKIRKIMIVRRVMMTLREKVRQKKEEGLVVKRKSKKEEKKFTFEFSQEERNNAEYLLVSAIQSVHYSKEMVSLLKLGILSPNAVNEMKVKNSPLATLSPYIDQNNVMRSGGRIGKAEYLPYETRFPIILPNHKNENVRALIRHYHFRNSFPNMHLPIKDTHNLLRQRFFILGGKNSVAYVINRCVICQRLCKRPNRQREGDLPLERMEVAPPFTNAGADVFGPFHLRHTGRGTHKKFVLIMCCMATRAVALFTLRDMTTSAVVNALIRMKAWYPGLKKIFSDQGSNFKGADREIREAAAAWDKTSLVDKLGEHGVTWVFGPAACGSAGGAWERLIGLTKRLIRSVVGTKNVDSEDFETLLSGAMGIMNKRPIVQASAETEMLVLTPSHFLHPYLFTDSNTNIVPPPIGEPEKLRHGWKASQALLDDFWGQFKRDYVTAMLRRKKTKPGEPIKIDDVVLIVDDQNSREYWKTAVVTDIINDDQLHPRRFSLKDNRGTIYDRHVSGVVKLELSL